MNVSLLRSVLPVYTHAEGEWPAALTRLPLDATELKRTLNLQKQNLRIARVFWTMTQQAATAILALRYKKFDALIKNFGCQITARDVQQKMRTPHLHAEAAVIQGIAEERLDMLKNLLQHTPRGEVGMDILTYLQVNGLDFQVSVTMAHLVRLRLLSIVNKNVPIKNENDDDDECPRTDCKPLYAIAPKSKDVIDRLVQRTQACESRQAANFIRAAANQLAAEGIARALLAKRLLSSRHARTSSSKQEGYTKILSLPLLYNTEVSLLSMQEPSYVLVKNKLAICNQPIVGAEPYKVFLQMPQQRILADQEVAELPPQEPLMVIEGYIANGTPLAARIQALGLLTIVNANTARQPQYATGASADPLSDEEAEADLANFAANEDAYRVIRIDHMYCASVQEER